MQNKQTDLPETCDICGEAFDSNDRCACFSTIIEDELDFPPAPCAVASRPHWAHSEICYGSAAHNAESTFMWGGEA